jgi:RNA 3'-terminal phosphate cyclase (ATP)
LKDLVEIDGSYGEGGGQILRTAIALSAVTGRPVAIHNIRAKRPRPGLQRQHLTAVRAVAQLVNAKVEGASLGSTSLRFYPGDIGSGTFNFSIGTAGSITLVLQALLPVLVYAPGPVTVTISGGTDVPWSPPIDYVRFVLKRLLEAFGLRFSVKLEKRGHYPRGGGLVRVSVPAPPRKLQPAVLAERGNIVMVEGISHSVRLPRHVAERQAQSATRELERVLGSVPIHIDVEWYEPDRDPHLGPGSGIVLWAITDKSILGGDSLGAPKKPAEEVGKEAALKLLEDLATRKALDRHASDMLILYAALACGESVLGGSSLTMHAWTVIHVIERVLPEVTVSFEEGGKVGRPFIVKITGACLTR